MLTFWSVVASTWIMDLAAELQQIYDSEINIKVSWLWDGRCGWLVASSGLYAPVGGIDVRLGDRMNGYQAEENVHSVSEILPWRQEAIAHFYPDSTYAKGLDSEVHARAARRVFLAPRIGAQVRCPHGRCALSETVSDQPYRQHCGELNASHGVMDEMIAFVCTQCGQSVKVEPPKPQ
jgi:hypothetical protein